MAAASGGCQLQLSDGDAAGRGGDGSAGVTKTEDGGAMTASAGASTANAGVPNASHGGSANAAAQGGSANASPGHSGGARSTSTHQEDCENPDAIRNDDREHAVDFGAGATLCLTDGSDNDWFYLDTPSDDRAHVIELDISETADNRIDIYVTAEKDGSDLGLIRPSQRGLKLSAFLTVGPGTRTLFRIQGYGGNTGTTTIEVSDSAEADDHEPNNDRASATQVQAGTEVSAQLIMPYVSATEQHVQDWYKVELAAGKHTFHVTAVPSDINLRVDLIDSTNVVLLSNRHGANRGATFDFTFSLDEAGSYYFVVDNSSSFDVLYSGTKADSYTQPYKFQID
jgi:hypothetical protein